MEHGVITTEIGPQTDMAVLETLYHTANGYLGVRNAPEEGGGLGGTYLNAFYEDVHIPYGEKLCGFPDTKQVLVNVPDAQTVTLEAAGERFALLAPQMGDRRQTLDMEAGWAGRTVRWQGAGGPLTVEVRRMASFALPNLFLMDYRVTSQGYAGPLRLTSLLNGDVTNHAAQGDPRVAAEPLRCLEVSDLDREGDGAFLRARTLRSQLEMACWMAHDCPWPCHWQRAAKAMAAVFEGVIAPGETLRLVKYVIYTDSLRCPDPLAQGRALLEEAQARGADALFADQKALLADWWERCRVTLSAPKPLAQALTYDLYQLFQATGRDGVSNVAAKGLSGEGYEGHTFWDSEIYVLPFFLWTQPQVARAMLTYRYRLLDAARANARRLGLQAGAMYPWRTISGGECSAYFPAGAAQYHINGDIAYAFLQYWYITGDEDFLARMGAEVLVETARAWLELGHMGPEGFCIDCVTGPDEYTCLVNNNFYTNACAQYHLRGAVAAVQYLTEHGLDGPLRAATGIAQGELDAFAQAAAAMRLPRDPALGISAQDDSFLQKKPLDWRKLPPSDFPLLLHYHPLFLYRHQVCKQADTVLAHLLFPDTADRDTVARSYDYYQGVTTHDSSLSLCVFAMAAARLGRQEGAEGFAATVALDLQDTHGNTRDGLHTASMGGAYLAMLRGFAGITAGPGGLSIAPFLPEGWQGYALPFQYRGRRLRCIMDREAGARLLLLSGPPLEASWYGQKRIFS